MKTFVILVGLLYIFQVIYSMPMNIDNNTVNNIPEDNGEPSENFLTQVQEYFDQEKEKSAIDRQTRQISGALGHGDTLALQTFVRTRWLSLSTTICTAGVCPNMIMTGDDWNSCHGEIFQIYRALGSGQVRAGDLVGLHYPNTPGRWLGCPGTTKGCAKTSCPGHPTIAHGFATLDNWYRCWGEVFRIYANGKNKGAVINSGDDIMLYYIQEGNWVGQPDTGSTGKFTCPGTVRPPPLSKIDVCPSETFKIWKRPNH